jgi:hypothetical protein
MSSHLAPRATALTDPTFKLFFLLRFLCFVAVVYLALHWTVRRLSVKPDSKLLWFFSVVTSPLTAPIKARMKPATTDDSILSVSLLFYGVLWLLLVFIEQVMTPD